MLWQTKRANRTVRCIRHSSGSQLRERIDPLCSVLLQHHLMYCVQFSGTRTGSSGQCDGTVPSLPEFMKHLDNSQSYGLILCGRVWSQDMDSMILVGPFQPQYSMFLIWIGFRHSLWRNIPFGEITSKNNIRHKCASSLKTTFSNTPPRETETLAG